MSVSRTFAIGDIHGGLRAVKELLDIIAVTENDHLIFLGDYVDGWSDSAETVFFLMDLKKKYKCTFIRGNHDDLCYEWLKTGVHTEEWVIHGGQATMNSYARFSKEEIETQFSFFENLENYVVLNNEKLFLHAGFTNIKGPEHEYFSKMLYWDRSLWELALAVKDKVSKEDEFYPNRLQLFKEIYVGHTPVTRIGKTEPVNAECVWNVDTGAAFKGPLTAVNIDTKEVFQTTPVYQLYPEEKGRN